MSLYGVIFDLDGTVVDSRLDFDAMRQEIGLVDGEPILEALEHMTEKARARAMDVLYRHELEGAERATLIPGVEGLLDKLIDCDVPIGIITRNSRAMAEATLAKFSFDFYPVLTRDDGPIKPDPWAVRQICRTWETARRRATFIGDTHFDLLTARRAGCRSLLYTGGRDVRSVDGWEMADHFIESYCHFETYWDWLIDLPNAR